MLVSRKLVQPAINLLRQQQAFHGLTFNLLRRNEALPTIYSLSNQLSSTPQQAVIGGEQIELPSNLILAEKKILEERPHMKTQLPVVAQFPLLHVPENIEVHKFHGALNEVIGSVQLEKTIFEVPIRTDLVHEYVKYIRNKRRQPKKTKRIGEIKGSNRKPHPQKKIGRSQAGNRRNSAWRGGQKAHGPVIRDYSIGMNKKSRALAMMTILVSKFRDGNLLIFDDVSLETIKTKDLHEALKVHGLHTPLTLMVNTFWSENFILASRNMQKLEHKTVRHLNGYEILRKEKLVFTLKAFEEVQQKLLYQYSQSGKAKAQQRNINSYLEIVGKGKQLAKENSSSLASSAV